MINGVHAIIYTTDAEADRSFFRDVLGFDSVDAGGGWLIFKLPPAELAMHPAESGGGHELYLMCDDVRTTVEELAAQGVEIVHEVTDEGFGLMTALSCPAAASSDCTSRATRARSSRTTEPDRGHRPRR